MRNMLAKTNQRVGCLTAGVSVESEVVHGAGWDTGDLVLERQALDTRRKSSRGLGALESQKVGTETSNVRSSHGSSGDGVLCIVSFRYMIDNWIKLTVPPLFQVERIETPGARMSTTEP